MYFLRSHRFSVVVVLLLAACLPSATSFDNEQMKLPSFLKVCRRSDPHLNLCARNSLNAIKDRLNVGIPEIFFPPIEPLVIPEMKLDQDSGAIYLHSTFTDIHIQGLSNFTLTDLVIDPAKVKLAMTMSIPKISMHAKYLMRGKIMMMPLVGDGDFKANFTDVELSTVMNGQKYRKRGRTHIKVKDIRTRYEMGNAEVRLENLFNGDKALGDRMNAFLNENWESLSDEVRPLMEKAVADIIASSTDKLFNFYSYDELLPE